MSPAKYSYSWANSVVEKLYNKYTRATEIVCETFDITKQDLAKYLAKGDPMFPVFRVIIHAMDIYVQIHNEHLNECIAIDYLRRQYRFIYTGEQLERIDKRVKELTMKEQGSRGAGRGAKGDEGQLPLNFS